MKLHRIDIKICATAYVVADHRERAKRLVLDQLTDTDAHLPEDGEFVTGVRFEELLADAEANDGELVTISPAVTLYGAWNGVVDEIEEIDV